MKKIMKMMILFSVIILSNFSTLNADGSCGATAYCNGNNQSNSGSVSCQGTFGCDSGPGWVECNGNRTTCEGGFEPYYPVPFFE